MEQLLDIELDKLANRVEEVLIDKEQLEERMMAVLGRARHQHQPALVDALEQGLCHLDTLTEALAGWMSESGVEV